MSALGKVTHNHILASSNKMRTNGQYYSYHKYVIVNFSCWTTNYWSINMNTPQCVSNLYIHDSFVSSGTWNYVCKQKDWNFQMWISGPVFKHYGWFIVPQNQSNIKSLILMPPETRTVLVDCPTMYKKSISVQLGHTNWILTISFLTGIV